MTSTTITPMQTFQERVKEKLRDTIADLLPDEALQELVKRVIDEEFFTKRRIPGQGWGAQDIIKPSQFQEMVLEAAKPIIQDLVKQTLRDNAEKVQASLDESVKKGLVSLMIQHMDGLIAGEIQKQGWNIQAALKKVGVGS